MALILCIETTSTNCSVALASDNGGFVNSYDIKYCQDLIEDQSGTYSHGERLHVFIDEILSKNKITANDLDAIAISKGPGSYTGLRIGVASAKGLCFALDIPLITIDTLEALALQAIPSSVNVIPMIDARRMEVYTAVFKDGLRVKETEAIILQEDTLIDYLKTGNVSIIGSGALKFQKLLKDENNIYIESLSSAVTMCDLAINAYKKNDVVKDIAYYEPFYLKEFKSN